jgi:acetylornithine/succinyldiaminopimelate/putrescine aminotransferase
LIALGKALGGGVPIGAAMLSNRVAATAAPGDHGTTYGGNLLACRAALVVLDALESGLNTSIRRTSAYLFARLNALAAKYPAVVSEVRGAGLIAGIDLKQDATAVVNAALDKGLLVNRTSTSVIRLLPPYIVTERDIDDAVTMLDTVIGALN